MKKKITKYWALFELVCLPIASIAQDIQTENDKNIPDLSDFSFLIGSHSCVSKAMQRDGTVIESKSIWAGQYILDGYAIADAYRVIDDTGNTVPRGSNFRSYDLKNKKWVMRWFDAQTSSWMKLGMDDKGGVTITDDSITFEADTPDMPWKIKFTDISEQGFTWSGSASFDNAENWYEDVQVINCVREE